MIRDSLSSPLRIAEAAVPGRTGMLGLTLCPGKKDPDRGWNRDLATDLLAIRTWGASILVSLIEDHEFALLGVKQLPVAVRELGMAWIHLPIRDVDIPDDRFVTAWKALGPELHRRIEGGARVLVHCRGGLGRTGLVAALVLVEQDIPPAAAIDAVRASRPGAIETHAQARYVLDWRPSHG